MEAADSHHAASKVIVQCVDPYNLYEQVAPIIRTYLPFENLNWKSSNRPTRSIVGLDVQLEREQLAVTYGPATVRKHQIPGLRQTPFVKIYLLRCDEKDTYKTKSRKELHEWIKSLDVPGFGKENKGQDGHDALEYIILHVVLPDTPAASQPVRSKHISVPETTSTESVSSNNTNSKSRWSGKAKNTIYDKLRADFYSSSQSTFERIAQVRLPDQDGRPSPALSPLELKNQWIDLIDKVKTAILQSFDTRVARYEEDLREKALQRSLPGWNFCTFFVLKEGLARGFESVGLLEDALQTYRELKDDLDQILLADSNDQILVSALLPYPENLIEMIDRALVPYTNGAKDITPETLSLTSWTNLERRKYPWRLKAHDYQQMIMVSQISAFDFKNYIMAHELYLVVRKARIPSNRKSGLPSWDARTLTSICEDGVMHINRSARTLRDNLLAAFEDSNVYRHHDKKDLVVEVLCLSWKWCAYLELIEECQALPFLTGSRASSQHDMILPPRTSSLLQSGSDSGVQTSVGHGNSIQPELELLHIAKGSKDHLITAVANILLSLHDVLIETKNLNVRNVSYPATSLHDCMSSDTSRITALRYLLTMAFQCYSASNNAHSTRHILSALAHLEIEIGDYDAALKWLRLIPRILNDVPETVDDVALLEMFMQCSKEVGNDESAAIPALLLLRSPRQQSRADHVSWWAQLVKSSHNMQIDVPFNDLFELKLVDPLIEHDPSYRAFSLKIILAAKFEVEAIQNVRIVLVIQSAVLTPRRSIVMEKTCGLNFNERQCAIELDSATHTSGWFQFQSLTIYYAGLTFSLYSNSSTQTEGHDQQQLAPPLPAFFIYPPIHSPILTIRQAAAIDLVAKRGLAIHIDWQRPITFPTQLRLRPLTSGLFLDLQSAYLEDNCKSHLEKKVIDSDLVLFTSQIEASKTTVIIIPYIFRQQPVTIIKLHARLDCENPGGSFKVDQNLELENILPLHINMEEIRHSEAMFLKFLISPTTFIPISLISAAISSRHVEYTPETLELGARIIFPHEPFAYITKHDSKQSDELQLVLKHTNVGRLVIEAIEMCLLQYINGTEYEVFKNLLLPYLRQRIQRIWTGAELEAAVLAEELDMWTFEEVDWNGLLKCLPKAGRARLGGCLEIWHTENSTIALSLQGQVEELRLSLDVPKPKFVVSTQIELEEDARWDLSVPVSTKFTLKFYNVPSQLVNVQAEVVASAEQWIIGGQCRISSDTSQAEHTYSIILIPQKLGHLPLPRVHVSCVPIKDRVANSPEILFEVEDLKSATIVEVRTGATQTTVGLGNEDHGIEGEDWIIASTARR